MSLYDELRKRLSGGWYAASLDHAATLAEEATWQARNPASLFVLSRVLRSLQGQWDAEGLGEQAFVSRGGVEAMIHDIEPAITAFLLNADAGELSADEELAHMNAIVTAFLTWRARDEEERR